MQMSEASRTVPYPRKALEPLKGPQCMRVIVTIITAYLLFITFTCLALERGDVSPATASRGAPGLIFSTGFRLVLDSKSGNAQQRSRAQFGVAPHLCTNFRVSRMPNRRTASPWQQLTAKSTVYYLIGAPK